jgi:hypothetical protein
MHEPNIVIDAHTSNSYRKFGIPTGTTGTPGHAPLSHPESGDSGGPVSSAKKFETGTPAHGPVATLFVATTLDSWSTCQPHVFARDVQINDTAYRRLDPEYYAWLRSKMNLAKMATDAGQLARDEFNNLRLGFNAVHEWAVEHFGEVALLDAIRNLDARDYAPPVAEPDMPRRVAPPPDAARPDAVAMVDAVRDRALALGWTHDSLYATGGSARPTFGRERGLVCFLRPDDRIGEVTTHSIEIILANDVRQRFYNPNVGQPWIRRLR